MRKECRKQKTVEIAGIQRYHARNGEVDGQCRMDFEGYAFQGFKGNWYFNSDRKEKVKFDDNGNMIRDNGQPFAGYGLEVEVECEGIHNKAVLAEVVDKIILPSFKYGPEMFKMQSDISLGGDTSVEIISQVMTKSKVRNDYSAWRAMFDKYFPAFGLCADSKETTCGMHVNVSNAIFGKDTATQWENIRKLCYIVNKHYDVFVRAFYRDPRKTHWCGKMDGINWRTFRPEQAENDHGKCMNLSHFKAGRVEIRLVGGQKDYFGFRNTMETVFHVCERVSGLSWAACDDLYQIFKGCNQYVYKRLSTECQNHIPADVLARIAADVETKDLELDRA
jgi:hypothetical protein